MSEWLEPVQQATQCSAIVVAGVWAYFKFIRGSTLAYRIEFHLEPEVVWHSSGADLYTTITIRNSGHVRVPFDMPQPPHKIPNVLVVEVSDPDQPPDGAAPAWLRLHEEPILQSHHGIEPGESILEDVLLPLPASGKGALRAVRVTGRVWADRSPWRRDWRAGRRDSGSGRRFPPRRNVLWTAVRVAPLGTGARP